MLGFGLDLAYKYDNVDNGIELWTFDISTTTTLSNFSLLTSSGTVTIQWSPTENDTVISGQTIGYTYAMP